MLDLRLILLPILTIVVIGDTRLIDNVATTETLLHCLEDGVVLRGVLVGILTLPSITPATIQASHRVGIGSRHQDLLALGQGQDSVVLEQYHGLHSGILCGLEMLGRAIFRIVLDVGVGHVKKAQTVLHAQHAAHSVIDTRHGYPTLIHSLDEQVTEVGVIWVHRHVDTGIDSHDDGLFSVSSHHLAPPQVVDVGPVGHDHAVPASFLLQPLGQVLGIDMHWHTVDRA